MKYKVGTAFQRSKDCNNELVFIVDFKETEHNLHIDGIGTPSRYICYFTQEMIYRSISIYDLDTYIQHKIWDLI